MASQSPATPWPSPRVQGLASQLPLLSYLLHLLKPKPYCTFPKTGKIIEIIKTQTHKLSKWSRTCLVRGRPGLGLWNSLPHEPYFSLPSSSSPTEEVGARNHDSHPFPEILKPRALSRAIISPECIGSRRKRQEYPSVGSG